MKYFISILFSALLSTSSLAQNIEPEYFAPHITYFLQECSGVTLMPPEKFVIPDDPMSKAHKMARSMAYLTCMTYTRGVVDGHAKTIKLYTDQRVDAIIHDYEGKNDVRIPPINFGKWWCIDQNISDYELMQAVLGWVAENEKRLGEIDDTIVNSSDFRMVVLINALQASYTCK